MIQIFKIIQDFDNVQSNKFFYLNDNVTRGHFYKLVVPRTNKQLIRNLFPICCIALWNKLRVDAVLSETVLTFKSRFGWFYGLKLTVKLIFLQNISFYIA